MEGGFELWTNHVFSQADKNGGKPVANPSSRGPNEVR